MALKVFDLECEHSHIFEGWFGSHEDYDSQQDRGLIRCPVCHSATITKRLSAPHLNMTRPQELRQTAGAPAGTPGMARVAELQAAVMRQVRELVKNTEDVGAHFALEARRIHEGEADERPIRGVATPEECQSLAEDGIEVLSVPAFLDDERLQ